MRKALLLSVLWMLPVSTGYGWFLSDNENKIVQVSPPLSVTVLKDEEYFRRLVTEIKGAKNDIDAAMYLFRMPPRTPESRVSRGGRVTGHSGSRSGRIDVLIDELVRAAARGVKVRVTLERSRDADDTVAADNRATASVLRNSGVVVVFDSLRRRTHSKVVVIDSHLTFVGSHNFTEAALGFNNELSVLIDSPECAGVAKEYIAGLRKGEFR